MNTQKKTLKRVIWNALTLVPAMLCAVTLLAYAGSGFIASYTSSSVCDGVDEADCGGVCLVSQSSHFIYCSPVSETYRCKPDGTANVTVTNKAGECLWGGDCVCSGITVIDTQVLPNTPVYVTKQYVEA
jgi:hypothetical protein